MTGIEKQGKTATVLMRGSNRMVLDEADRSLHDALCVVRCLVQKRFLVPGGAACEVEVMRHLTEWAKSLHGMESYSVRAFAEALEIVPYTLAENAGLDPIQLVTDLRSKHAQGNKYDGINVRKGSITNMLEENVVQPLLVTTSAISLASECTRMILKIDDLIQARTLLASPLTRGSADRSSGFPAGAVSAPRCGLRGGGMAMRCVLALHMRCWLALHCKPLRKGKSSLSLEFTPSVLVIGCDDCLVS